MRRSHKAAVRGAREVDALAIGYAAADEIGNEQLEETDIVGEAADLLAVLYESRRLLAGQEVVPPVAQPIGKDRGKSGSRPELIEAVRRAMSAPVRFNPCSMMTVGLGPWLDGRTSRNCRARPLTTSSIGSAARRRRDGSGGRFAG